MPAVRSVALWSCLAASLAIATAGHGAEPAVVVHLASGRQFRGEIDSASTAQMLVLRTTTGNITLRRPIDWQRIVRLEVDGQAVEVAKVRAAASRDRGAGITSRESGANNVRPLLRKIELMGEPTTATPELISEPQPLAEPQPRVAMVAFDPSIANWDADIETDGVAITVAPLDSDGYLVPAGGTLEVELYVPQRRTLDLAPMSGGDTLELVERWTRAIAPEDFGSSGVRLRLPFGAITPELQPNWTASSYGLVHMRLAIPGQGVYEDSRDGVRVRPFAPNRDRLEMKTGQRFLPTENLGRRD
jgi:hypothetical protein